LELVAQVVQLMPEVPEFHLHSLQFLHLAARVAPMEDHSTAGHLAMGMPVALAL
jgi:hypothetical protein